MTTSSNKHFSLTAIVHACNLGFVTLRHNFSFTVYVNALQIQVYFHCINIGATDLNILLVEIAYFYFILYAIYNCTEICGYPYVIKKVTYDVAEFIDFVLVNGFYEVPHTEILIQFLVSASISTRKRHSTFVGLQ